MQKKLLACLLVTPAATAAVANTTVPGFPTEASADATQEGFVLDFKNGGGLVAPVGIYTVKFEKIQLYPGDYELNLGDAENILVKVDGADVTVDGGIARFHIGETKDVVITLNADNREVAFSCTKADLTVIVSEADLNRELTEDLAEALPVELTEDNTNQTPQSLKTEYADLKKRYDDIAAEIAKIDIPLTISDYGTFELWKGAKKCTIGVEIAALKADVEAYNEKANAENLAVADRNANKEYWDTQSNLIKGYQKRVDPYAAETDEFVKARTQEALDVVNGMIAKLNAELEATKDFAKKFETPEGYEYPKVMAAIGELEAAKNIAVADKAAYENYVAEMKKFTETYNGVLNALNLPADVDGKEGDAFLTTRRNATAEATKIYEGLYVANLAEKLTVADAANEEINETALNAKISALTAGATEMTTVKTNFEALAKAENDAYDAYKKKVGSDDPLSGLKASYAEAKATKVPDGQVAEYNRLTAAVEKAFGDLEEFVNTHYGTDLSTAANQAAYTGLVTAVEEAISKLKTDTGNYDKWNKLATDLDTNISEIEELSEALRTYVESKDKGVTIDLSSKFEQTIKNIQASINQLKNGDDTSEIEKAIDTMLETAKNIDNAFRKAFDAYIGFKGDLAAYKTFIGDKLILKDKDGKEVYGRTNAETKYDDLAEVVDGYKTQLNEVAKLENQKCLEGALALADKIGGSTFEADLEKAKKDFAYNASVENKKHAEGVYNATEANYNKLYDNGNGVPGIDAANLGALTTEKDNAVAKVTEDASPEDLTGADNALKTLVDNCTKFDNNVNAYAALYEVVKDVPTDIEEALKFEGDCYTIDPAKAHFTEVLNGYKADYDKFMADIKTALQGKKVVDGLPDKGTVKGFTTRANELTGNIKTVKERIQKNQQVYDALLDDSKMASAEINKVRSFIETNIKDSAEKEKRNKELDALADELTALNLVVTGDFGHGALDDTTNGKYHKQYLDIVERANNLQSEIDQAVSGLNNAWIPKWEPVIDGARSVKDAAVRVYNDYYWDIDNKGYHKFVEDVLAEYRDLYDYTKKISDLDAEFRAWVQKQNDDRVVFSQNDYNEWTDKIKTEITDKIEARQQELVDAMNTKGSEYWTQEYTNRASLVYDEMKGALLLADMATEKDGVLTLSADLAGTPEGKVFEDAIAAMPKAIDDKAKADNAESGVKNYASQIGLAMDAIADELDKIKYTADQLEAAAKVHLATLYNDFTVYAAEAKTEAGKADFVTEERIKKAIADIEAQETAAAEDYKGIENAFDALRYTQADPFKDFADAIKNILDKLNEESEANEASKKLYDDYTGDGGYIPSLNSDLDALKAYAASMAAYSKTTDAIAAAEAAVNELAEFVETNKATLSKDECKTEAETLKGEADKAIEDGYAAVRTAETEVLAGLIKDVRVAFDNAKAETAWAQENAAKYEAKINAAMAEYAALDGKTDEEFQTAALKLENDLCTCLSGLEEVYSHDGTSADIAKANLDKEYNTVKGNIETSDDMEGFEEEVQTEYADKYQALSDELDSIYKRYHSDDAVVVREANYLAEIKAVQAELDALNAEAAQADQEAKYNKDVAANASALAAELAGYQARYDALLAYTQQHELYEEGNSDNYYWGQLNNAAWYIAYETQWLADSQKEDAAQPLTPASVLPYRNNLNNILNNVDYNAHYQVVNIAYNGALTALNNAVGALADAHLVPADRAKLQNDYDTAYLNFNKADQDFNDTYNTLFPNNYFDWEKLGEYVKAVDTAEKAFNDVVTASQAIIDAIGELHFIPGDVEADPDHEVSAVDVQQVIAWIGEDMTFDDLVASSPRQAYAADVNGDSKINIADVVAISNIILNDLNNPSQAPRLLVKGVQTAAENNLTVALGETVDGVREYAVMINNTTAFVGGQLDINVGAGMEIVDIELTERGADHKLYRFDNNSGARVVIASMANDELRGNSGAMLIVRTRGAGKLTVGNAVFADINATAYGLAGEGMSAIDSIGESFRNAKERIYNVAGQALDRIQRGVNIIRKSDGTTTKEMH